MSFNYLNLLLVLKIKLEYLIIVKICSGRGFNVKIGVMLACYNRKEMTRNCVNALVKQLKECRDCLFDIYIYDDGSTDGTYQMLRSEFQDLIVVKGKGNAYWCKSMYYLMNLAKEKEYNFYLMVNDDVEFDSHALATMLNSYELANCACGITGTTRSIKDNKGSYGGYDLNKNLIEPNGSLQECNWANWNCFLLDSKVLDKIGLIDGKYQHSWGDIDYSYRMNKKGIPIYVATAYIGNCEWPSEKMSYYDNNLKWQKRLQALFSPKGLPIYSYIRFHAKTEGIYGVIKALYGYASLIWYIVLNKKMDGIWR